MLTVVLVVLAVVGLWAAIGTAVAFLAGGVISVRDLRDAPYGASTRPRPVAQLSAARPRR